MQSLPTDSLLTMRRKHFILAIKIINGEINVIGISVKATNTANGNAWTQYGYPDPGMIEQTNTLYDLLSGRLIRKAGIEIARGTLLPSNSSTNTFGISSGKKSSKGMPHGDGGRALKKAEKRIKELQEKMKTASAKERKEIQKKIDNLRNIALKKDKGETHWNK